MFKYSFSYNSSNTGEIKYNTPLIKDSTLLEINFYDQAGSNAKSVLESSPTIEIYVHNQNMSSYIYFLGTVNTVFGNKISFNTTYENGQSPELIKPNIAYDVKFEAKSGPSTDTGAWHHTPNTGDATGATGRIFNNAGAIVVGDIANTTTLEGSFLILTANTESYTFNDAVLSTSILGYESNVIGDNDIPNRKFVVDLANQTLINGGNPSPTQEVTVGVVTHADNSNQTFLNYKCGVRPSVLSFLYGSYGDDNLDASTRFLYNIVPPEMDQYVVNGNNSLADKDGCLIQFASGSASFPNRKGGHIQFNSGGNPTSQTNLTNGDIRFICGNSGYANSGRDIRINGERRGVLTNFSDGQMGPYESFCTQAQDFPNNAYIASIYQTTAGLPTFPAGAIVGTTDTQTVSNKSLIDASTYIIDDITPSKILQFNCASIAVSTTRTITAPDRSGTAVLSNVDMPVTLTTPVSGDLLQFNGTNWVNLAQAHQYSYWSNNATSSLGVQNNINWVQGSYVSTVSKLFTAGANNSYDYTGTETAFFEITYSATATVSSNNRTVEFFMYKNPDNILNPSISGLIGGSTTTSILRTSVNDTDSVSTTFAVQLATTDFVRLYVSNLENNDAIVVSDLSLKIKKII